MDFKNLSFKYSVNTGVGVCGGHFYLCSQGSKLQVSKQN